MLSFCNFFSGGGIWGVVLLLK